MKKREDAAWEGLCGLRDTAQTMDRGWKWQQLAKAGFFLVRLLQSEWT